MPFEVPEGWEWCRYEEYIDVRDGTHDSPKYLDSGYPFVTSKNLRNGEIDFSNVRYISEEDHLNFCKRSCVEDGDILFAMIGSIGNPVLVRKDREFSIKNVALFKPYCRNVTNMEWVLYYLQYVQEQLKDNAKGGMQPFIPLNYFRKELLIPIPPHVEQIRIINELKNWIKHISVLDTETEFAINIIDTIKLRVLNIAINGKLIPQDNTDEPAIELLKRINPQYQPADNRHYENLPETWEEVELGAICQLFDGKKVTDKELVNLDVKYLRGSKEGDKLSSGKYVRKDALMILVDGENSGEVFITPHEGYQGSTFKQLRISSELNRDYVLLLIQQSRELLKDNKVGSAIPHLNKKLFKQIHVPIPPYNEQERIVQTVRTIMFKLDKILAEL